MSVGIRHLKKIGIMILVILQNDLPRDPLIHGVPTRLNMFAVFH